MVRYILNSIEELSLVYFFVSLMYDNFDFRGQLKYLLIVWQTLQ